MSKLFSVLLGAACFCAAGFAQVAPRDIQPVSGTQPFSATLSGTCTNKDDFSFTGVPAGLIPGQALRIYCVTAGRSTQGHYTAQILAEEQLTGNPCQSPAGAPGGEAAVRAYLIVLSFAATDEQLFLRLNGSGKYTECLTGPGTTAPGRATLDVIGGTGRYEGAAGTLTNVINPIALAFSALGGDGFLSAFSGTLDGFLTLK